MKTMLIAGGSGFLGQILENYFKKDGYNVKILTRNPKRKNDVFWNAKELGNWTTELEYLDVLINLTGKSVDCRYTEENKKLIYDSRIDSTHALGLAINLCNHPPKLWINSSTATIYRHSTDKEMDETTGEIGDDFSMNIAKSWENAFFSICNPKTRKVALRTSIVLGKNGGAMVPLINLTKLGLGGRQGTGFQKVSWIHEQDYACSLKFIIDQEIEGIFNITSPKPTDNRTLMAAIRKALGIPFGLNHSVSLLRLGAKLIGTETELVLKSRNVIPDRLLKLGFNFHYSDIASAAKSLI